MIESELKGLPAKRYFKIIPDVEKLTSLIESGQEVQDAIAQRYDDDLEKRIAGYSPYHFSRIFKKYSNTTFINFLNRRRIRAAELLLLESGSSITDVAMQVGFASLTTFNRVFKSINGCTPSEYKKLYRTTQTSKRFT